MNKNLLIVGAGIYGVVASEIASDMGCFEKIAFVDDGRKTTPNGIEVIGTIQDIEKLAIEYSNIIVAIGNSDTRLALLGKITDENFCQIVSLISPKAYIAPSAQIMKGCIIEPMAVVQAGCLISTGCIISAGAVINHASMCSEGVHIDCNATVEGFCRVPAGTKICSGEVYREKSVQRAEDLFADIQKKQTQAVENTTYSGKNSVNRIGKEGASQMPVYDKNEQWVKDHMEQFGEEPSFL